MVLKGAFLNIIKVIYNEPTANIILNGEKLKALSLKPGTDKDVHCHHYSTQYMHSNQTKK